MGVTGLGGLPSQSAAEAPAGPLWQGTAQAGLGDQPCGMWQSPCPLPALVRAGPIGLRAIGVPCTGSAGLRGCVGADRGRKRD